MERAVSHVVGAVTCMVADTATRSPMDASYFTAGEKKVAVEDSMGLRGDIQRNVHCLVYVPLEVQSDRNHKSQLSEVMEICCK